MILRLFFSCFAALFLLGSSTLALASTTLEEMLRFSLRQDPKLLEAKAEQEAAIQNRKASETLHYPTVSLTSSQILTQHHQFEKDHEKSTKIGVVGKLNLYAWGGIEASIKRDTEKERFAYYKFFETREELGRDIATLYIEAIHYNESLAIAKQNLARHQKFLNDLRVVVEHDSGRGSELSQAESRYLLAKSTIIGLERSLQTTLSRLNLYAAHKVGVNDLVDPFRQQTARSLFAKYGTINYDTHPSILAQRAERESAKADVTVANAATKPQINLEGLASRHDRDISVSVSWDLLNRPAHYNTEHASAKLYAADARIDQVRRDITERYETAKIDMLQSQQQANISKKHMVVQQKVADNYAKQFKVSRRSLLEVLDAYAELSRTETTYVNAKHDFRAATLAFLLAQAKIAFWAGLPENL